MTAYQEYRRLMDDVLEHDCVDLYNREMCSSCRDKYERALELENEFGRTHGWLQMPLAFI